MSDTEPNTQQIVLCIQRQSSFEYKTIQKIGLVTGILRSFMIRSPPTVDAVKVEIF